MPRTDFDEPTRGVKLLHLILLGGGVLIALVFVIMVKLRGPILVPDSGSQVIAFSFAGIGLTAVAFAVLLLRPRIPERASSEALTDYWSAGVARQRSLVLWILCENAGIIAALGYLLTGHLVALAVMGIALIALAWLGPARIAEE
jgi:hypothetical protein